MPRTSCLRALCLLTLLTFLGSSALAAAPGRPAVSPPQARAESLVVRAWRGVVGLVSGLETSLRLREFSAQAKGPAVLPAPAGDLGPTMDPDGSK